MRRFSGRRALYRRKNRETVLEVAAKVREDRPDLHLVMVGALTPALSAQAERLDLGPALHVLDRVAREDMATLSTTAAVLLFPSHSRASARRCWKRRCAGRQWCVRIGGR
jgi:glycosyltransferase involved in cell wall biosynthesis